MVSDAPSGLASLLAIPFYEPALCSCGRSVSNGFRLWHRLLFAPLSHTDDHVDQPMSFLCQEIFLVPDSVFCRRAPQDACDDYKAVCPFSLCNNRCSADH
jgi:hypothetical protein